MNKPLLLYGQVITSLILLWGISAGGTTLGCPKVCADTTQAFSWYHQAEEKWAEGDFAKSNSFFQRAAEAYQKAKFFDRWADCQYNLAFNLVDLGEYKTAITLAQETLSKLSQLNVSYAHQVKLHKVIGVAELRAGNYDRAYQYFNKALSITQSHNENYYLASLYNDIGTVHYMESRFDKALTFFRLSIKSFGTRIDKAISVKPNIASAYIDIGNFSGALQILLEALEDLDRTGNKFLDVVSIYHNLGTCYLHLNDFEKAIAYFDKTVHICEKSPSSYTWVLGATYNNLGMAYNGQLNFDQAEKSFKKSFELYSQIYPSSNFEFAMYYNNLARRYVVEKKYDEAFRLYNKSLQIARTHGKNKYVVEALNNIAFLEIEQGKIKEAKKRVNEILGEEDKSYFLPRDMAFAHEMKASLWFKERKYEEAITEVNAGIQAFTRPFDTENISALPSFHEISPNPYLIDLLAVKANYLKIFGQHVPDEERRLFKLALQTCDSAIGIMEKLKSHIRTRDYQVSVMNDATGINLFDMALSLCESLDKKYGEVEYREKAFTIVEKSRSVLLRQAINQNNGLKFLDIPDSVLTKEQELRSLIDFYQQQILENHDLSDQDRTYFQRQIFELQKDHALVLAKLENDYPQYYRLRYANVTVPYTQIQQEILNESNALLRFYAGDSTLYVFYVTKHQFQVFPLGNRREIEKRVEKMIESIKTMNHEDYAKWAFDLYKILIKPISIDQSIRELIVIPDGMLHYLPFEALLTTQTSSFKGYSGLPYLLYDFGFQYHVSASLLIAGEGRSLAQKPKRLAAFAPVKTDSIFRLARLPNALKEAKHASEIMKGDAFLESEATERRFKARGGNYAILHLATHTILNDEKPLYSKLLFYPSEDSLEDDVLYGYELFNMSLPTDLVILSSCNTGSGKLEGGEGVMSLAQAFMYAGATDIMKTMWPISDQTSSVVMRFFYEGLSEGMNHKMALQKAKLRYLEQADEISADPFLWAGFVLIGGGEYGVNEDTNLPLISLWVLLLTGLVVIGLMKKRSWLLKK